MQNCEDRANNSLCGCSCEQSGGRGVGGGVDWLGEGQKDKSCTVRGSLWMLWVLADLCEDLGIYTWENIRAGS